MFAVIAHADWSVNATKRWCCVARRVAGHGADQDYQVSAPRPVADVKKYFETLSQQSIDGSVLAGVDFPLGLPVSYARRAGVDSFVRLLPQLGARRWADFFDICEQAADICAERPFYPRRPGGSRHAHLCNALAVSSIDDLRRHCELKTAQRAAASPLFWTLGAQQVGRAAISGWRDLLQPALLTPTIDLRLWPFEGNLAELRADNRVVVAETYPAESGLHLGLPATGRGWSKRRQIDRRAQAPKLVQWAEARKVVLDKKLRADIRHGFGTDADGEDRFDATVGTFGMLEVALGHRREAPALTDERRRIEGWILGQL